MITPTLLLSFQFLVQALAGFQPTDVVRTTNGPVKGFVDTIGSVQAFKNIPYGRDTSTTRFKAPEPPKSWIESKNCTSYGNICPQPLKQEDSKSIQSEDCLNLNIWTPAIDDKNRPVLVYFHGGGYDQLTVNDPTYDGAKLAHNRDVVVVTVNHRLNGFGYLYLGGVSDEYKAGNPGQLDLVLALSWVKHNIGKFGGNNQSITIFGQSGGGAKIATLMATPQAKGLFHRAWTMSGQQITARTVEHAKETALEVLSGIPGNSTTEKLSNIPHLTTAELRRAIGGGVQRWTPVLDGVTLPFNPFYPTANEQSKDIPMVMGNTYDETRTLIGGSRQKLFQLSWQDVPKALENNIRQFLGNMSIIDVVAAYRQHYPSYTPSDVFFAASTAARSWKSMIVQADIRAKQPNSPLWVYYLRWKSPYEGGTWGAAHTFDVPLVFDNPDALKETSGVTSANTLAEVVSKALVHFAQTGEPKIEGRPDLDWSRYDLKDRRSMIFDNVLEVTSDDRGWERKLFESAPYIQPGT